MSWITLPPVNRTNPPPFTDETSCRQWLKSLPQANPAQMQASLIDALVAANHYLFDPDTRLNILECLREPIHTAQLECERRISRRPLPFVDDEAHFWESALALWQGLSIGYLHVINAQASGKASTDRAALSCARALATLRMQLLAHYHAAILPDRATWRRINGSYAAAERLGVAEEAVNDRLLKFTSGISPAGLFCQIILLDLADPYALSLRQIDHTKRWLGRWRNKLSLLLERPADCSEHDLLCIDLAGEAPRYGAGAGIPRWIVVSGLVKSVKKRIVLLRKGGSPTELKLGEDLSPLAAEVLLSHLYTHWRKEQISVDSLPASDTFIVATRNGIHRQLGGGSPPAEASPSSFDSRQHLQMATLGSAGPHVRSHPATPEENRVDTWSAGAERAGELRMNRPAENTAVRLASGQLVATRPRDTRYYALGWLHDIRCDDDHLLAKVRLFPGEPKPVWLRAEHHGPDAAFLLPAVAAVQAPESLVAPSKTFRNGAIITIYDPECRQLRMDVLMDRGSDYERIQVSPL